MTEHQHDFRRFDDTRALCAGCGQFTTAPEPEWVEKLLKAIAAQPHVCTHYYPVPYTPTVPYWSPFISQPNTITVTSGTIQTNDPYSVT